MNIVTQPVPLLGKIVIFFLGGGGGDKSSARNLGGHGENSQNIFEIFIPEISANASRFKN